MDPNPSSRVGPFIDKLERGASARFEEEIITPC